MQKLLDIIRARNGFMKPQDDLIPTRRSLLTRLKNWDDDEAWKRFFDTYWKLIYSAAIKAGLSDAEAQDAVQETVIAVARKMHAFKYDPALGSFKGWLLHITRWRIADQFRKRRGDQPPTNHSSDETARTPTDERMPDPESLNLDAFWEGEWKKNLLEAAIERAKEKVTAKEYQLFDLYAVQGWAVRDIVRTVGVSANQVYMAKSRVSAVIKKEVEYLETRMI
jgi:RNA polymerase sigma factor (sigma-70 family)